MFPSTLNISIRGSGLRVTGSHHAATPPALPSAHASAATPKAKANVSRQQTQHVAVSYVSHMRRRSIAAAGDPLALAAGASSRAIACILSGEGAACSIRSTAAGMTVQPRQRHGTV